MFQTIRQSSPTYHTVETVNQNTPSPWARRINAFAKLPAGWHFGEGMPITKEARTVAHLLTSSVVVFGLRADVMPDLGGGLLLSIAGEGSMFDADVDSTGQVYISDDRDNPDAPRSVAHGDDNGTYANFIERLSQCRRTSESFLPLHTMRYDNGSRIMYSSETATECRSAMKIAR